MASFKESLIVFSLVALLLHVRSFEARRILLNEVRLNPVPKAVIAQTTLSPRANGGGVALNGKLVSRRRGAMFDRYLESVPSPGAGN